MQLCLESNKAVMLNALGPSPKAKTNINLVGKWKLAKVIKGTKRKKFYFKRNKFGSKLTFYRGCQKRAEISFRNL